MKIPELLSPCGNFEKMEAALLYGADAVYLAGKRFGMRSAADNFTDGELDDEDMDSDEDEEDDEDEDIDSGDFTDEEE